MPRDPGNDDELFPENLYGDIEPEERAQYEENIEALVREVQETRAAADKEIQAARDEIGKERRDTSRWALSISMAVGALLITVLMGALATLFFQVSNFNSEMREARDRLTVLEERMRQLNIPLTYVAPGRNRSQSGTPERSTSLY